MRNLPLLLASLIIFAWLPTTQAAEVLRRISWSELKESGQLSAREVLPAEPPEKGEILRIENPNDEPKQVKLLELRGPAITAASYAIRGRIRYEDMKTRGWLSPKRSYLEMWSYLSDGSFFFSRTLGTTGPMERLVGTSGWRDMSLPAFIGNTTTARPDRLVVNLVFEGSGTVSLGPLELEQYDSIPEAMRLPGAWWDERTAGLVGGILGSVLGCLGGLIGVLAGRGRARGFVMALSATMLFFGVALLGAGAVALIIGQPYEVWFPLLLGGIITTGVLGPVRHTIRRRHEQRELEQISAMDLGTNAP